MNYSNIKVKMKPNYFEVIQQDIFDYAGKFSMEINTMNYLNAFIELDLLHKLNARLRTIVEKEKKQRCFSFTLSEAALLVKIYYSKKRNHTLLGTAVLLTIVSQLQPELFNRSMN